MNTLTAHGEPPVACCAAVLQVLALVLTLSLVVESVVSARRLRSCERGRAFANAREKSGSLEQ